MYEYKCLEFYDWFSKCRKISSFPSFVSLQGQHFFTFAFLIGRAFMEKEWNG